MILIVDDDEAMASNCSLFLELQGFEVCIATSGAEALAKIRCESPQLLISDCDMPEMTGAELCDELQANPTTGKFPILLMSGGLRSTLPQGTSYDAYLRKPFLGENLLVEVRRLLAGIKSETTSSLQGRNATV
jgi:DNA-binding response OmpR family regulator